MSVKVWLDILTPKQANFLGGLHQRLTSKGFKTLLTTREYREVNELLELKGLKAVRVGRHGGGELKSKLIQSSTRVSVLAEIVEDQRPDVAISFSSPEAARVAFGLKIPHYCVSDSPHAEAVCKLTVPLSRKLFTPWVIPVKAWARYGIASRDIVRYRALDPVAWLSSHGSLKPVADGLGLDRSKPLILIRTPEEFAAYLTERSSNSANNEIEIVEKLLETDKGLQIVVLPRYDVQRERLKKRFGIRVVVPEHVIDTLPLIKWSSVFIGGGGTMTAEAALLGVPVISYYPGDATFVEKFLIRQGLAERVLDPSRVAQRAVAISKSPDPEYYRKRSARLLQRMEDPLKTITDRIFRQ